MLTLLSCGPKRSAFRPSVNPAPAALLPDRIRCNQLIELTLFKKKYNFSGMMVKNGNNLLIAALGEFSTKVFTVYYNKTRSYRKIHVPQLERKAQGFNFLRIASDGWKIFVAGSGRDIEYVRKTLPVEFSTIRTVRDRYGYIRKKAFLDEGGKTVGIVLFRKYRKFNGLILPQRIIYENRKHNYRLRIVTTSASTAIRIPRVLKNKGQDT